MNSDEVRGNCVNIFLIGAPIARTESSLVPRSHSILSCKAGPRRT